MNIKQRVISLITEVDNGKYSNIALNEYFKENRLDKKERGFITEVFYGVIRNKIFIDEMINKRVKEIKKDWLRNLLRISIYQITFMKSDERGVVWEAAELTKKKFSVPVSKFVNGVLRSYAREKDEEIEKLKAEGKFDILYSYPLWFFEKVKKDYGDKAEEVLKSLKKIPYMAVRVNKLTYSEEKFEKLLKKRFFEKVKKDYGDKAEEVLKSLKKIPYMAVRVNKLTYSEEKFEKLLKKMDIKIIKKVDTVYYLDSGAVLYFDEFKEGKIIAQDGASYLSVKVLNPKPDEHVVDTCAAPGSKTVLIAEFMENRGEIMAFDIYPHKIKLIEENCSKMGIDIVKAVKMDARKLKEQGKKFDKILYLDSGAVLYFDEFKEGKIIAQDGASYLSVKVLNPKPDEHVIDTCAAPGSKTVLIAEFMENRGEIMAFDIYPHKIKLIEENCSKMGIDIVKAVKMDARKLKEQGKKFDKILVDAPCSGYGVIRKKPEILYSKGIENVEELSSLQYEILESASSILKDDGELPCSGYGVIRKKPEILYSKGIENVEELSSLQYEILESASSILKDDGELVYSTCTITYEENTGNVKKFLENNPQFETLQYEILESASSILKDDGELVYSTCTITYEENTGNVKKFLENNPQFETVKFEVPENVNGDFDEFGGFTINYKEEILDNFYIVKFRKKGE